jgi:hypothetical protein
MEFKDWRWYGGSNKTLNMWSWFPLCSLPFRGSQVRTVYDECSFCVVYCNGTVRNDIFGDDVFKFLLGGRNPVCYIDPGPCLLRQFLGLQKVSCCL